MPGAQKKPRSKRCSYVVGYERCRRVGFGNPPMCRAHSVASHLPTEEGDVIERILENADRFLSSNKGNQFVGAVTNIFEGFMAGRQAPQGRRVIICPTCGHRAFEGAPCGTCITKARIMGQRAAQMPPKEPPKAEDPRQVLGFQPEIPLTRTKIKERQRALAIIMHPDQGGSDAAMQRINEAADALLANLP